MDTKLNLIVAAHGLAAVIEAALSQREEEPGSVIPVEMLRGTLSQLEGLLFGIAIVEGRVDGKPAPLNDLRRYSQAMGHALHIDLMELWRKIDGRDRHDRHN